MPTGDDNDALLSREPRTPADVFRNPPKWASVVHTDWEPAFPLSRQQREQILEWMICHDAEKHTSEDETVRYTGAIGGAYTWKFTPTSLGTVVKVICSCEEELDVSDYDNW